MANNYPTKEMPTGDGNPTAGGANNGVHFPTEQRIDQVFHVLQTAFAMRGHAFFKVEHEDGPVTYWTERWGLVKHLPTIDAARRFLEQIGGRL